MKLRKFVVSEFLIGKDAIKLAGQFAVKLGAQKVLIVTDAGIIKAGWVKHVINSMNEMQIPYKIFDTVSANPKDFEVMEGAKTFTDEGCDAIVAIGGGSPIDCAKGIGIVCSNNKHINEFEGVDEVKLPMPPLICIPTTAGTAADISQFAIITNTNEKRKIAIISKAVVPDIALICPTSTTTMDSHLTAATGMDALVHAIEAYVSNASSSITDLHALEAIRLISQNLELAYKNPNDLQYRENMMLGSLYAGMAFSNASLGIVHAMAHSLGGLKDSPHGECNAILLEQSIEFNFECASDKYTAILHAMDYSATNTNDKTSIKNALIERIRQLRSNLGINYKLRDLGVTKTDLKQLAINAYNDACLATNPADATVTQIEELYERIY